MRAYIQKIVLSPPPFSKNGKVVYKDMKTYCLQLKSYPLDDTGRLTYDTKTFSSDLDISEEEWRDLCDQIVSRHSSPESEYELPFYHSYILRELSKRGFRELQPTKFAYLD